MNDLERSFQKFLQNECILTKEKATRPNSEVGEGAVTKGYCTLYHWSDAKFGVSVIRGLFDGVRTSPVIEVLSADDTKIKFKTEGGIYTLEVES